MARDRYAKVIRQVTEAQDLARSGLLSFDGGSAGLYFLWGQPSHAFQWEGGEIVEGEAALRRIAVSLAKPGSVTWNSKDVVQRETLRCNADDVIQILEALRQAPSESPLPVARTGGAWDGVDRRRPEGFSYSLTEFPLLPTGAPLWVDVPSASVHLDVILANVTTALITMDAEHAKAAGIVLNGELHDALWVDGSGQVVGPPAWQRIIEGVDALACAYELDDRIAEALPILWRSRIVHRDLDKRWVSPAGLLGMAGSVGGDRGLIVAAPDRIGIALYLRGELAGAWTSTQRHPSPSPDGIVEILRDGGSGAVSIIERLADDLSEEAAPRAAATGVDQGVAGAPAEPEPDRAVDPALLTHPPIRGDPAAVPLGGDFDLLAGVGTMVDGGGAASFPAAPAPPSLPAFDLYHDDNSRAGTTPAVFVPEPAPQDRRSIPDGPDFEAIIAEVRVMVGQRLGADARTLDHVFDSAERSVPGLRHAIAELRRTDLPGHDALETNEIGMEMLRYVAERLTGA